MNLNISLRGCKKCGLRLLSGVIVYCFTLAVSKAQSLDILNRNAVYQYAVNTGSKKAYLWIPPSCRQIRGIIISFANLLERNWLEDPIIRNSATRNDLAIILIEPSVDGPNPGLGTLARQTFLKMLKDLSAESGYKDLQYAPFIPIDHSIHGVFTWNLAGWLPNRTIAALPVKTFPLPLTSDLKGIPTCYIIGENDEWPPNKDIGPWSRDFVWPQIRQSATTLRRSYNNMLIGVVTDPGGGHLDWSDKLSTFMALYIKSACRYRLPKQMSLNGYPKLKVIEPTSGWLTDTGGLAPDKFAPAPYKKYKGGAKAAYWFPDKETAIAATAFASDRVKRQKQMLTFEQQGTEVAIARQGFVPLQFLPDTDGVSFGLKGRFLSVVPMDFTDAGILLGHSANNISFRVITGPAVQISPGSFKVAFNRSSPGGDIWIQEECAGNEIYSHAVQPAQIHLPGRLTNGKQQTITFTNIPPQHVSNKHIMLQSIADSSLPVKYYIISGPAIVNDNVLTFTPVPARSIYPVKITVTAYQWGRVNAPGYQTSASVTQTFLLYK